MNKAELVDKIATESGLTKKDTETFLNSFINAQAEEKEDELNKFRQEAQAAAERMQEEMKNKLAEMQATIQRLDAEVCSS